jgi:hypothetical protein
MTAENANRRQAQRANALRIDRAGDAAGDPVNLVPLSPLGLVWSYPTLDVGLPLLDAQTAQRILSGEFDGLDGEREIWPKMWGVD